MKFDLFFLPAPYKLYEGAARWRDGKSVEKSLKNQGKTLDAIKNPCYNFYPCGHSLQILSCQETAGGIERCSRN